MSKKISLVKNDFLKKSFFSSLERETLKLLKDICNIETKTFYEKQFIEWITKRLQKNCPNLDVCEHDNNLIFQLKIANEQKKHLKHLALIGHCDVVCPFYPCYIQRDRLHGAGASDMKGTLAIFIVLFENYYHLLERHQLEHHHPMLYDISLVITAERKELH